MRPRCQRPLQTAVSLPQKKTETTKTIKFKIQMMNEENLKTSRKNSRDLSAPRVAQRRRLEERIPQGGASRRGQREEAVLAKKREVAARRTGEEAEDRVVAKLEAVKAAAVRPQMTAEAALMGTKKHRSNPKGAPKRRRRCRQTTARQKHRIQIRQAIAAATLHLRTFQTLWHPRRLLFFSAH